MEGKDLIEIDNMERVNSNDKNSEIYRYYDKYQSSYYIIKKHLNKDLIEIK